MIYVRLGVALLAFVGGADILQRAHIDRRRPYGPAYRAGLLWGAALWLATS